MKKLVPIFTVIALGFAIASFVLVFNTSEKPIKFVSMAQLYEASSLRESEEKTLKLFEDDSNTKLREMDEEIKRKEIEGIADTRVAYLRQELNQTRELLSAEYQKRSQACQDKIWKHINSRLEKFGKTRGYRFILGATGDGSIMYADQTEDVTKEALIFVNR